MFVTKRTHQHRMAVTEGTARFWKDSRDDWHNLALTLKSQLEAEQTVHAVTEQAVRSAESALRQKEKQIDSLNEQVANLVEKRKNHASELEAERRLRNQANNRAEDAERELADAKRVTFIVTAHRNNAAAAKRYGSLDDAVAEYRARHRPAYPLYIYAMVGDLVVSDVTDPEKWGETLPVSTERNVTAYVY